MQKQRIDIGEGIYVEDGGVCFVVFQLWWVSKERSGKEWIVSFPWMPTFERVETRGVWGYNYFALLTHGVKEMSECHGVSHYSHIHILGHKEFLIYSYLNFFSLFKITNYLYMCTCMEFYALR